MTSAGVHREQKGSSPSSGLDLFCSLDGFASGPVTGGSPFGEEPGEGSAHMVEVGLEAGDVSEARDRLPDGHPATVDHPASGRT